MKRIAIRQGSANDGGRKITHQDIMGVEEIQEKRGLCCKHYRMGAGKACAVYFNEPVHYYDEDSKELKEIDNTIRRIEQAEGEKGGYENASGEVKIRFARSIGDAAFLTLEKGMHKMSWRLCDSSAACLKIPAEQKSEVSAEVITRKTASHAAELRGRFREINAAAEEAFRKSRSEVRYNGIKQGADLQYILGNSRLKENIVIKQKMPDYRFVFEIAAECLELELSENKDELEFYVLKIGENNQREKEVIFAMPAAYMYDAKGNRSENVVYEVEQSGAGKYILNVTADKQWIESAEREFPVTIDPTVVFQKNNFITTRTIFSSNGVSSPADAIDVTAGWLTGGIEARVLLKWNTGALGNVKVTGAFLNLYKEDASYTYDDYAFKKDFEIRELTESWNAQTVTWATSPSCGGLVDILRYSTELAGPGSGDEIVSFDVTKAWENPNGVMIKAAQGEVPHSPNGNECSHYIQFYSEHVESDYEACKPYLLVTYMENNQVRSDQQLTNSVGRAGNASLDLFTKNLQFTHSDLELQGNILPLSVTHVYNSRTGTDKDVASSRGKYSSGNLGMGAGWKPICTSI